MTVRDNAVSEPLPPAEPANGRTGPARQREPLVQRLENLLFTRDPRQRIRLVHVGLSLLICCGWNVLVWVLVDAGVVAAHLAWPYVAVTTGGLVLIFGLIRSGLVLHLRDPSLTMPGVLFAIACAAWGYSITGIARGVYLPILALVLMYGMFGMSSRQMLVVAVYTVVLFAGASVSGMTGTGTAEPRSGQLTHLISVMVMVVGVVALSGRVGKMRAHSRQQRAALAAALERIRELAALDELTGLLNRRASQERLAEELERSDRIGLPLCLVLMDLDHFKRVNDLHGHPAGDAVLRGFADLMRQNLRTVDVLGRWGGEEFLLLMPGTSRADGEACVRRVVDSLSAHRFDVGGGAVVQMTCSAGLVACQRGESVVEAVDRADHALYRAKREGRNRVVCG